MRTAIVFILTAVTSPALAQIELNRFFPPAATIGESVKIEAEGKFSTWPPTIVCDRDDVGVTANEESGSLNVQVKDDALPGVTWIRMHDSASATSLVPLLIEREPITTETEPNNRLDESNQSPLPALIAGRLEKSGDVDSYSVRLTAGQTLVASVRANQLLSAPMDAVLQLVDSRGNVLAQSDDVRGLDPQIVFSSDADFEGHVRVFAFPETPNSTIGFTGNASFVYLLRLTTDAIIDHTIPLLITDDAKDTAQPFGWNFPAKRSSLRWSGTLPPVSSFAEASGWQWHDQAPAVAESVLDSDTTEVARCDRLPIVFSGHLQLPGETDRIQFPVQSGQRYRASVHSRRFGFEVDSVLKLIDSDSGEQLGQNDDQSRNEFDAALEFRSDADRVVELQISDLVDNHGMRTAYSVLIEALNPQVALSVSEDHFTLKPESPAKITVSIDRANGYDSKIRLVAEGLPDGVQCDSVISEPKGDTAKSVQLTIDCNAGVTYQGNFRIVGYPLNAEDQPAGDPILATFTVSKLFQRSNPWMTVAAE